MIKTDFVKNRLQQHYGLAEIDLNISPQSGGDIHQSFALDLNFQQSENNSAVPNHLFAKVNTAKNSQVLKSEYESLRIINSIFPNYYPVPILFDQLDDHAVLMMSFHSLSNLTNITAADAGRALATQHKTSHKNFGWSSDNFIGLTPQENQWHDNWPGFFNEQRLTPMLLLAVDAGLSTELQQRIIQIQPKLDTLLSHDVSPSLVHGDLWSGNLAFETELKQALFYDPAPYYGDREVDLAMTELFGRQPDSFYHAYQQEYPFCSGYQQRRGIYNLYHALNHVALFGTSYHALVGLCLDQIPS